MASILFLTNWHIENIYDIWYLDFVTQLNSLIDLDVVPDLNGLRENST